MNCYRNYKGQCVGRILYFMHEYAGPHIAGQVIVGELCIEYNKAIMATYHWEGDVPIFKFEGDYSYLNKIQEDKLKLNNLDRLTQLHEEINIYYAVDGYHAQLISKNRDVAEETGATIQEALDKLNKRLHNSTLEGIRLGVVGEDRTYRG